MMKLHGFSQSGNTYKVALMLQGLGQPWQAVHLPFDAFAAGATRQPDWRAAHNPMGEVPILVLDDGRQLTQSAAILLYLADRFGAYGGQDGDERQSVLQWLFFDNHKFTSYLATWRFMKSFAPAAPDPALSAWLTSRVHNAMGIVEKHLDSHSYLVGGQPTVADLSLAGYVYYPPDETGIDLAVAYPAIDAWRARLMALPGWKPPYDLLPGDPVPPRW